MKRILLGISATAICLSILTSCGTPPSPLTAIVTPPPAATVTIALPSATATTSPTQTAVPSPTTLPTPTAIPLPTVPPVPIRATGLEGASVRTVCLKVDQTFPQYKTPFSQAIQDPMRRVITNLGLQVVDSGCDGTLTLSVMMRAVSELYQYSGSGETVECFSGAELKGQMNFAVAARAPFNYPLAVDYSPKSRISGCGRSLDNAPYPEVWSSAVIDSLRQIWGNGILNAVLKDPDQNFRKGGIQTVSKLGPAAKEFVPVIVGDLLNSNVDLRLAVAMALGDIGPDARSAVPALITSIQLDRDTVRAQAVAALRKITGQNFGENAQQWLNWWNEQK